MRHATTIAALLKHSAPDAGALPRPGCFWIEDSASPRRHRAPFGRAQRGVEEHLEMRGWRRARPCPTDDREDPDNSGSQCQASFAFRHPGAPTFYAHIPDAFPVGQLPASWDENVDDKLLLHELLSSAAAPHLAGMAPPTFAVDHALLASLEEAGRGAEGIGEAEGKVPCWFLKHRLDAKRPRVHAYPTAAALAARLRQMGERAWRHFVVQREVHPPLLLDGRGFTLRAHVLCVARGGRDGDSALELFLHDTLLVSENEGRHGDDPGAAARVLQSGTRKPAYPLADALPELNDAVTRRAGTVAAAVFGELRAQHAPLPLGEGGALYQIYGLDFVLDTAGRAFLLEINRTPRIATGAMGEAHALYAGLVVEALVILGVVERDASSERPGGSGGWRVISQAK